MPQKEKLTIGRLAALAGINVETVRYYQRRGLIDEPEKPLGGQRHYSLQDVARLGFIRRAQQLGFSLEEVRSLLEFSAAAQFRETRRVAEHKYAVIESRIAELESIRQRLAELIDACRANRSRTSCPIITHLSTPD